MLSCVAPFENSWIVAQQAISLSMEFPGQEYHSGLPFSSSRGSSQPRDQTSISCVSCIAGGFFYFYFLIYYFELKDKSFTIFLFPPYINMNQSRCTCVPSLLNYPPTPHPIPPLKVVTEPWVEGSSSKFYFTCGNVCLSMVLCLFLLPSPPCPQACCLCLRLHCCLANRFINTIFLEYHIGVLIYDSFSLSDLLQSV